MSQARSLTQVQPAGMVSFFGNSTTPAGWLKCDGSAVSRTAYSDLFAAIGTTYGTGDGSTTFNVPDLRGEFIRGWDNSRGVDTGRAIATSQLSENLSHDHGITDPGHHHLYIWSKAIGATPVGSGNNLTSPQPNTTTSANTTGITINTTGGSESRPRNIAMLACIKY